MDSTPPRSKLSTKRTKLKTDPGSENDLFKTDTSPPGPSSNNNNRNNTEDDEYSPVYFPLTQETSEDIDVLWDWHSPQTGERKRKKQKRLIPIRSPKCTIQRVPSNTQPPNFDKLREELKALQEELAQPPEDESCLCISPQQENEFKSQGMQQKPVTPNLDDFFNDSMDEHLLLFSQQVEADITINNQTNQPNKDDKDKTTKNHQNNNNITVMDNTIRNHQIEQNTIREMDDSFSEMCDNSDMIDNLINKYTNNPEKPKAQCPNLFNNTTLIDWQTQAFNTSTQNPNTASNFKSSFQRTVSENDFDKCKRNVIETVSGKMEFHRTKSFELDAVNHNQSSLPKSVLDDIERKRMEAKAKLESKRKLTQTNNVTITSTNNVVPASQNVCSAEEIERKRLQALAKLQAKRLQSIVEKNRQEALKKLQASRIKNASMVKSTLTKRL